LEVMLKVELFEVYTVFRSDLELFAKYYVKRTGA
jgi:hypothetical protein